MSIQTAISTTQPFCQRSLSLHAPQPSFCCCRPPARTRTTNSSTSRCDCSAAIMLAAGGVHTSLVTQRHLSAGIMMMMPPQPCMGSGASSSSLSPSPTSSSGVLQLPSSGRNPAASRVAGYRQQRTRVLPAAVGNGTNGNGKPAAADGASVRVCARHAVATLTPLPSPPSRPPPPSRSTCMYLQMHVY